MLGHRNGHAASVEELRVLPVQFLVGINQEKVSTLKFYRSVAQADVSDELLWKVVVQRKLFHAYKIAFGGAHVRIVIGIVCPKQVRVFEYLAVRSDSGNIGVCLVARLTPAVTKLLWSGREVRVARPKCGIETHHVTKRVGDEDVKR